MADKPTKAELAKLPGGADFDVDNASTEDFDKHAEILRRRSLVGSLSTATQAAPAATAVAVPAEPNPNDIRAMKDGEVRFFDPITWGVLGDEKGGWVETVEKPSDLK